MLEGKGGREGGRVCGFEGGGLGIRAGRSTGREGGREASFFHVCGQEDEAVRAPFPPITSLQPTNQTTHTHTNVTLPSLYHSVTTDPPTTKRRHLPTWLLGRIRSCRRAWTSLGTMDLRSSASKLRGSNTCVWCGEEGATCVWRRGWALSICGCCAHEQRESKESEQRERERAMPWPWGGAG